MPKITPGTQVLIANLAKVYYLTDKQIISAYDAEYPSLNKLFYYEQFKPSNLEDITSYNRLLKKFQDTYTNTWRKLGNNEKALFSMQGLSYWIAHEIIENDLFEKIEDLDLIELLQIIREKVKCFPDSYEEVEGSKFPLAPIRLTFSQPKPFWRFFCCKSENSSIVSPEAKEPRLFTREGLFIGKTPEADGWEGVAQIYNHLYSLVTNKIDADLCLLGLGQDVLLSETFKAGIHELPGEEPIWIEHIGCTEVDEEGMCLKVKIQCGGNIQITSIYWHQVNNTSPIFPTAEGRQQLLHFLSCDNKMVRCESSIGKTGMFRAIKATLDWLNQHKKIACDLATLKSLSEKKCIILSKALAEIINTCRKQHAAINSSLQEEQILTSALLLFMEQDKKIYPSTKIEEIYKTLLEEYELSPTGPRVISFKQLAYRDQLGSTDLIASPFDRRRNK